MPFLLAPARCLSQRHLHDLAHFTTQISLTHRMIPRTSRSLAAGWPLWVDTGTVFTLKTGMIALLCAALATTTASPAGFTKGREVAPLPPEFKPGDYVWKPEVSPAGPVVIIVSVPEQEMLVYRNGVRIGRSTISTGAK